VYSEETAWNMIDMMKAVIDHGTGRRLRYKFNMEGPIAGKTGTTNNNSDGWFVGCVPQLVTAVWVGGDERDIHFSSTASGQGSVTALPVWALYMLKVYGDKSLGYDPNRDFEAPAEEVDHLHHRTSSRNTGDSNKEQGKEQEEASPSTPAENQPKQKAQGESYFE